MWQKQAVGKADIRTRKFNMRSFAAVTVAGVLLVLPAHNDVAAFNSVKKNYYQSTSVAVGIPTSHSFWKEKKGGCLPRGATSTPQRILVASTTTSRRLSNDNHHQEEMDDTLEQRDQNPINLESPTPLPPLPKLDASILLPWFLFVSLK